jgi:hypothetical protein
MHSDLMGATGNRLSAEGGDGMLLGSALTEALKESRGALTISGACRPQYGMTWISPDSSVH